MSNSSLRKGLKGHLDSHKLQRFLAEIQKLRGKYAFLRFNNLNLSYCCGAEAAPHALSMERKSQPSMCSY